MVGYSTYSLPIENSRRACGANVAAKTVTLVIGGGGGGGGGGGCAVDVFTLTVLSTHRHQQYPQCPS